MTGQLKNQLEELWRYRLLLWALVLRDIKGRYKQTSIGIAWSIIQPLFLMFVFSLVFSKFFKVNTGGVPYPVFSYAALLPWTFLSKTITTAGRSYLSSRALITKVYFPREIIPLSNVLSALVDFGFASIVFIVMLVFYQIGISIQALWIPLLIVLMIALGVGLSLILSVFTALFRDLEFVTPLFVQLLMYASPVIYSVANLAQQYKQWFYLNPLTGIIDGFRNSLLYHQAPDLGYLMASTVMSGLILVFGYWLFKRTEHFIVDIL